jgi:hypothetical protein
MLPDIRVASPCSADWEKMIGDDRVRHCSQCNLNVYNLSAMTNDEVERLIAAREGRLCVRLYRRQDGTILTRDCPSQSRVVVRRVSRVAGAALSAVMSVSAASAQSNQQSYTPLVQIDVTKAEVDVIVTDPSGAVIPHAKIRLVDEASHATLSGVTNLWGRLQLPNLANGAYSLTVQALGFEPAHQVITVSGFQKVEVQLEVGHFSQGASIIAEVPVIETQSTSELIPEEEQPKGSASAPPSREPPK